MKIADNLSLPAKFVTSTQVILAKKGSGKSYTASVQAEELLAAGHQVVAIDPTGAWWGLRSRADGTPGFAIAVLGGDHGDVPLESTSGQIVADAVVESGQSMIIDVSLFTPAEMHRFLQPFLATLYRRNRAPMHLMVDEADVVAPQKPYGSEMGVLHAMQNIVRRGRIKGIGCTMITQRPSVLNKDVLTQADMLTALRMNHPLDLKAVKEWVTTHDTQGHARAFLESLPSLEIGTAWVWAPASNLFQKVKIRPRTTFDSGRTPEAGEVAAPREMAAIDIKKLGKAIADSQQRAKENDPKALRERIAQLESQQRDPLTQTLLEQGSQKIQDLQQKVKDLEHANEDLRVRYSAAMAREQALRDQVTAIRNAADPRHAPPANASVGQEWVEFEQVPVPGGFMRQPAAPSGPPEDPAVEARRAERAPLYDAPFLGNGPIDPRPIGSIKFDPPVDFPTGKLGEMLTMLARVGKPVSRTRLAVLVGYHVNAKGFVNNVGALRGRGLVTADWPTTLTDAGRRATAHVPKGLARAEVIDFWRGKLDPKERAMFDLVLQRPWGREELAAACNYHVNAKSFVNQVGRLRGLGLVTNGWPVSVSEELQ